MFGWAIGVGVRERDRDPRVLLAPDHERRRVQLVKISPGGGQAGTVDRSVQAHPPLCSVAVRPAIVTAGAEARAVEADPVDRGFGDFDIDLRTGGGHCDDQ